MPDSLTNQLRAVGRDSRGRTLSDRNISNAAADRIEALEAALDKIALTESSYPGTPYPGTPYPGGASRAWADCCLIAHNALVVRGDSPKETPHPPEIQDRIDYGRYLLGDADA